jgi:thioester reductase-like protein
MSYLLFTGATGLLGGYLLCDLLKCNARLAVVVRDSRMELATSRIESILARWERILGYALPRPVVLPGDITQAHLGLEDSKIQWIAEHCSGVLHNAASLSFEATTDGEPYRSNITGTEHVLELCRRAGIRQFFHVSTAYVCGLRQGVIREGELAVGQEPANPYEATKIQSETLVRNAEFLDRPTVFRPAIIVGDSISGYTTTYHGFYAPLKSFHALSGYVQERVPPQELMHSLGFTGAERKNFVPVDWISAVMTHVIRTPEHHHQTYHLTPDAPISVTEVMESMTRSLTKYTTVKSVPPVQAEISLNGLAQFQELLSAYRSYWRDDPLFDKTNTNRVAAHLPCPELNATLLDRLCRFAIQANFGWPKPAPIKPAYDFAAIMYSRYFVAEVAVSDRELIGLQVNGPGGGQWSLATQNGVIQVIPGIAEDAAALVYLNSSSMRRLVDDPAQIAMGIETGRVLIVGRKDCFDHATRLLHAVVCAAAEEKVVA